uniref:Uncharacterized protein n=1 Tax=Rhizophora mucronata TaxID=61149 RepID=A0A2P2NXL4_RHIMU
MGTKDKKSVNLSELFLVCNIQILSRNCTVVLPLNRSKSFGFQG